MRVLPGPTKSNQVLAWSPDGRFVVAGGTGDGVTVWPADGLTPGRRVLGAGHGGEGMRFCPRTGRLYVAFRSGGVWALDPDAARERQCLPYDNRTHYAWPAISDDGQTVVLHRYARNVREVVGHAVADDGSLMETWSRTSGSEGLRLVFRPNSDQLFTTCGNWVVKSAFEWTVAVTGASVGRIELPPDTRMSHWELPPDTRMSHWELSPDGERVAWLAEHVLHVQRLDEPAPRVLPTAGEFRRGLAWSPDGRTLAYGTKSVVRLLDADTLTEVRAVDWGTGNVRAIAFSPDGLRAAVSAEGGKGWVTVFDLE